MQPEEWVCFYEFVNETDAAMLANIYQTVFESYPFSDI